MHSVCGSKELAVQSAGTRYFCELTLDLSMKESLINHQIDKLLLGAFHLFPHSGDEDYDNDKVYAQESLCQLFKTY